MLLEYFLNEQGIYSDSMVIKHGDQAPGVFVQQCFFFRDIDVFRR